MIDDLQCHRVIMFLSPLFRDGIFKRSLNDTAAASSFVWSDAAQTSSTLW